MFMFFPYISFDMWINKKIIINWTEQNLRRPQAKIKLWCFVRLVANTLNCISFKLFLLTFSDFTLEKMCGPPSWTLPSAELRVGQKSAPVRQEAVAVVAAQPRAVLAVVMRTKKAAHFGWAWLQEDLQMCLILKLGKRSFINDVTQRKGSSLLCRQGK